MNNNNFDLNVLPVKIPEDDFKPLKMPVHPNLPNIRDGAVMLIVSRRGEGKSTLISNLILNPNFLHKENFEHVFVVSNTINQDKTAQHLKKEYEATCYDKYDDQIIKDIIAYQKSHGTKKADIPRTAILLDDCLGSVKKNSTINYLSSRSRHLLNGGLLLFSTQTLKSLSPVVRTNATQIVLMRTDNAKEKEKFYEEFGSVFGSKEQFYNAFDYCTNDRFNFCYINLDLGRPKVFRNFTEDITNKYFPHLDKTENLNNYNIAEE